MRRWREPRPTNWPATDRHRSLKRDEARSGSQAPGKLVEPPRHGVTTRAITARDAGAQVFVVPAEELSSVDGDRLDVRGVEDLSRAVQLLRAA